MISEFVQSHGTAMIATGWLTREAHLWYPRLRAIFPYLRDNGGIRGMLAAFFVGKAKAIVPALLLLAFLPGCTVVGCNRVFPKLDWYWSADAKACREENRQYKILYEKTTPHPIGNGSAAGH